MSAGAALGPLLAGVISPTGWNNVFYMLISADVLACLVRNTTIFYFFLHISVHLLIVESSLLLMVIMVYSCVMTPVVCLSSVFVQACLQGNSGLLWTCWSSQGVSPITKDFYHNSGLSVFFQTFFFSTLISGNTLNYFLARHK